MKKKNILVLSFILAVSLMCTSLGFTSQASVDGYVTDGLVALYDGVQNTDEGHDNSATTWMDLVGNHDLALTIDENCYFTENGFMTYTKQHTFDSEIVNVVNGEEFTIELLIGEFEASHLMDSGRRYSPLINCGNDNISVYYDRDKSGIIFKTAGMHGGSRATIAVEPEDVANSLLTIVFEKGESAKLYFNNYDTGLKKSESGGAMTDILGIDNLFIGQATNGKQFRVEYTSIRFYDRALSEEEVLMNAERDEVYTAPVSAKVVKIAQPVTNVVGDLAVVDEVLSDAEFQEVVSAADKPATVILNVNEKTKVVDVDGKKIMTVQEAIEDLDYKTCPAFYVSSEKTVDNLAKVLKKLNFYDVYFVSDDAELVNYARKKMSASRGIIDYREKYTSELSSEQITEIRKTTMKNNGTIALLSAEVCTKSAVEELYYGRIPVWAYLKEDTSKTEVYEAVLSGAMGVVCKDTDAVFEVVCDELEEHTMTRTALNVGHKGMPNAALENTITGAKAAVAAGAEFLELDIYMSKDGKLVVCHSNTTGAVCDQDLVISESTWAELQQLNVVRNEGEEEGVYAPEKLATLDQFFEAFKGTDVRYFIEFKGGGEKIVKEAKKIVESYELYNKCHTITFDQGTMEYLRKLWPEMTIGYLDYATMVIDEADPESGLLTIMSKIGKYNASCSPTIYKMGPVAGIRAAQIRGIMMSGWTYENQSTYLVSYFNGASAITGDDASAMAEYPRYIRLNNQLDGTEMRVNDKIVLDISEILYNGENKVTDNLSYIVIEGNDNIKIKGNELSFTKAGEVTFVIGYTHQITTINEPVLYTKPITVTVKNVDGSIDSDDVENPEEENNSETNQGDEQESDVSDENTGATDTGDTISKYVPMFILAMVISAGFIGYYVARKRRA